MCARLTLIRVGRVESAFARVIAAVMASSDLSPSKTVRVCHPYDSYLVRVRVRVRVREWDWLGSYQSLCRMS